MPFDITSANATAILTVSGLYDSGLYLQMFSADTAITQDEIEYSESRIGVDGYMVAGYVPSIKLVTINLEAASPSIDPMYYVGAYMTAYRTIYRCNMNISIPSIGKVFTWTNGVLTRGTPMPALSRILDPVSFTFSFQDFRFDPL